jgi:cell fate (sporulation/competence/biofilm development) regulator YlbF (YheA/YmcA/DUF963 family)
MDETMDGILRLARQLGEEIRKHPRYVKLMEADKAVRADKVATEALDAYNRAYGLLAQKEQRGQPLEVEEKHRLERLKQVVASNDTFKAFLRSQADYTELMHQMNEAIFQAISAEAEKPSPAKTQA